MNFQYTDKIITYIDRQLIRMFYAFKGGLVSFDELNILQSVDTLYLEIGQMVRKAFLLLANHVYAETREGKTSIDLGMQWVERILAAYDPVSKYIFTHEEDRKRARLYEALIASTTKQQEIDAAMRSMSWMCRVYAVRVTDEAVLQAYDDDDEEYVRWIAEKDEKTCSICRQRDGMIYDTDELPAKPHPNCRCRYEKVKIKCATPKHSPRM